MSQDPEAPVEGRPLMQAAWVGAGAFTVTALAATVAAPLVVISIPVALLLFLVGTVAFGSAYLQALQRSREDAISVVDLYFLTECAPRSVRRSFLGALALMLVVAFVSGGLRLYSGLAFGIMAPIWPLGLAGLWAARYGTFPPREGGRMKPAKADG